MREWRFLSVAALAILAYVFLAQTYFFPNLQRAFSVGFSQVVDSLYRLLFGP